jgi:hypothetical protein
MSTSDHLQLDLPADLGQFLQCFEVDCVAGCCGLDAFTFDPIFVAHSIAANGEEPARIAHARMAGLINELRDFQGSKVTESSYVNWAWTKVEAIAFFEMLQKDIADGLALGAIAPGDPHIRNDPSGRFIRG